MASFESISAPFKQITLLVVILAMAVTCVKSARMLEGEETQVPTTQPVEPDAGGQTSVSTVPPLQPAAPGGSAAATSAIVNAADPHHPLTFFMHDILGGSNPSARAVTGIVTNPAVNAQVAFAKPNGANINVNNGIPQNNGNNGIINNNNIPFLTGLSGFTSNVFRNNGNINNMVNGGVGFPISTGGQLPAGMTFQKLMFGTLTVFDDELTEGIELGSGLVGKAQGFYIASSEDGNSQTMAFTVMFEESRYADSLSFFGVHRTAVSESHLAIMGGTGKFVNAEGFAIVKTFQASNQQQHETDGVETILQFTVYLTH